jgi:ankyrin repeat protein
MNAIAKFRRGCLWLLVASGVVIVSLIGATNFFFRPNLYSTEISPDGRFKMEIWLNSEPIAMPGSGGSSNKSGTVYLYDLSGRQLDSANFDMLMNMDIGWKHWNLPKSNDPNIQLIHAAIAGDSIKFAKLLPDVNPQFRTSHNRTFIHAAAIGKNLEILEKLLEKKIDINVKDKESVTALQLAAEQNAIPAVKLLLKYGADANVRKEVQGEIFSDGQKTQGWQETPLLNALERNYTELAGILIANGADINVRNRNQDSPLQLATNYGNTIIIDRLLTKGAKINAQDNFGNTALFDAITNRRANSFKTSKLLVDRGAKVNIANTIGQTPLMLAASLPDEVNNNPKQSQTIQKIRSDLIQLLIDNGADINAKDKNGKTAFDLTNDPIIRQKLKQVN